MDLIQNDFFPLFCTELIKTISITNGINTQSNLVLSLIWMLIPGAQLPESFSPFQPLLSKQSSKSFVLTPERIWGGLR